MRCTIRSLFVIIPAAFILSLLGNACSDDAPNQPAPAAPTLTIEVLTTAPEMGQPVEFRATVTGVTLSAPVYTWDFGDGKRDTLSAEEIQHTYTAEGTFTVKLRVIDTVANFAGEDSTILTVVDNRPVWQHWNDVQVTLFGTHHGVTGYHDQPVVRIGYTCNHGIRVGGNTLWSGTQMIYRAVQSDDNNSEHFSVHVSLGQEGGILDSLYFSKGLNYNNGMTSQGNSFSISITALEPIGAISRDFAVYRAEGPVTIDHVPGFYDENYASDDYGSDNIWAYDSLAVTPDMYVEVRFYKR